ncbi:MAG: DUF4214 domain-containing protein [Hyphomicrobiales bacterium]
MKIKKEDSSSIESTFNQEMEYLGLDYRFEEAIFDGFGGIVTSGYDYAASLSSGWIKVGLNAASIGFDTLFNAGGRASDESGFTTKDGFGLVGNIVGGVAGGVFGLGGGIAGSLTGGVLAEKVYEDQYGDKTPQQIKFNKFHFSDLGINAYDPIVDGIDAALKKGVSEEKIVSHIESGGGLTDEGNFSRPGHPYSGDAVPQNGGLISHKLGAELNGPEKAVDYSPVYGGDGGSSYGNPDAGTGSAASGSDRNTGSAQTQSQSSGGHDSRNDSDYDPTGNYGYNGHSSSYGNLDAGGQSSGGGNNSSYGNPEAGGRSHLDTSTGQYSHNPNDWDNHSDNNSSAKPMLMDLDDDGFELIERTDSTVYLDLADDGYQHRTAWVGTGDGVLIVDLDGDNTISDRKEVIFTDWLPSADTDAEALRAVFDTNNNGLLDAGDERWSEFKVMVTGADGTQSAKTLTELGIQSINLEVDRTGLEYADGSSIDGETTFTRTDGSTGRAATATLSIENEGYAVTETSEVDGDGNTVVTQELLNTAGELAQIITRTSSPDGLTVTTEFDTNADGVIDRAMSDVTVVNGDGSRTRTQINRDGGGVLVDQSITTTSADLATIVIERDELGGGFPTQRETQTKHLDNSFDVTIENLSPDGSVLNSTETLHSTDRLTKTVGADADGNSIVERQTVHETVRNVDGSRVESNRVEGGNGTLLNSRTVTISADQQTRMEVVDLDGDTFTDLVTTSITSKDAAGKVTTVESQADRDGNVFATTTASHTADGLEKTFATDLDGDLISDRVEVDKTIVGADDSETQTVTRTSADGRLLYKEVDARNADKLTGTLSRDTDGDGVFDQIIDVTKGGTGIVSEETSHLAADGSLISKSEKVTSADGLTTTTKTDLDGDGAFDRVMSDVVILNVDGSSTQTIEVKSAEGTDQTLISREELETSANGMVQTRKVDRDGNSSFDESVTSTRTLFTDGSQKEVVETKSGDGTVLARSNTLISADRQTISTARDNNNDDRIDLTEHQTIAANGEKVLEVRRLATDLMSGQETLLSSSKTTTSSTGLLVIAENDLDGDGLVDLTTRSETVLAVDGSSKQTTTRTAQNNSDLSSEVVWTSGNKMESRVETDLDDDGDIDTKVETTTSTAADGTVTTETKASNGTTLASTRWDSVSADGLTETIQTDTDGDGSIDLTQTTTKLLNADGSTETTSELREGTGVPTDILRSSSKQTVSANGRIITTEQDINGDGLTDRITTETIAGNDDIATVVIDRSKEGSLQSQIKTVASANGLKTTLYTDRDGNGAFETVSRKQSVLNADGSRTTTSTLRGPDETVNTEGTLYSQTVTTVSGNGRSMTIVEDADGNGFTDSTIQRDTAIAQNGGMTTTETATARDGSTLATTVETVSGNGRSTSRSVDVDGNDHNDTVTTAFIGDDGVTTTTSSFFDEAGNPLSKTTTSQSGNGLVKTWSIDLDGDDIDDRSLSDVTSLNANGSRTRIVTHKDGQANNLAKETVTTSGNGLKTTTTLDLDGDGTTESETVKTTVLNADGSTADSWTTRNVSNDIVASASRTTTGNGLTITETSDYDNNGFADRESILQLGVSGGSTETVRKLDAAGDLMRSATIIISADERTTTTSVDLDGDGKVDQEVIAQLDDSQNLTTTHKDLASNGTVEAQITKTVSGNGTNHNYAFDVDGDGQVDITRTTSVSYDAAGNEIEVFEERDGSGRVGFKSTTTSSANGLTITKSIDRDGDGEADSRAQTETILNTDGSQTTTSKDWLADGSLRSSYSETVSADGRIVSKVFDFDGNGRVDMTSVSETTADGAVTVTETGYTEYGAVHKTSVTTTSADGLTTTILRDGVTQTITGSVTGNGSYTWDNGVTATATETHIKVDHEIDSQGLETWTMTSTSNGSTTTLSLRLDSAAKAYLLAEATKIYDAVFDRDMDRSEVEVLVQHAVDGQLDLTALANSLLTSEEYTARYDTLSDTGFVARAFQNTFGRTPDLSELKAHLDDLNSGTVLRAQLLAELAQSAEYLVVGNGYGSTNNYDVFLMPIVKEDDLTADFGVEGLGLVTNEADVLISTDVNDALQATGQEAAFGGTGGNTTITGSANEDKLIGSKGDDNLSGDESSDVGFVSASGNGELPVGSIVLNVTYSKLIADVDGDGRDDLVYMHSGGSRVYQYTYHQSSDDDVLIGGEGNDTLKGGDGNDTYIYNRGDGDDVIFDEGSIFGAGDILKLGIGIKLTDLEIRLDGNDLLISFFEEDPDAKEMAATLGLPDLTGSIRVQNWNNVQNRIEHLSFSDDTSIELSTFEFLAGSGAAEIINGTVSSEFINANGNEATINAGGGDDLVLGGGGGDTIAGEGGNDRLNGQDGDDSLSGGAGDDVLTSGTGSDTLTGGAGSDTFTISNDKNAADIIKDFEIGTDQIDLADIGTFISIDQLDLHQSEQGTVIQLRSGQTVLLEGIDVSQLTNDQFAFDVFEDLATGETRYSAAISYDFAQNEVTETDTNTFAVVLERQPEESDDIGAGEITAGVDTTATGAQDAWKSANFDNRQNIFSADPSHVAYHYSTGGGYSLFGALSNPTYMVVTDAWQWHSFHFYGRDQNDAAYGRDANDTGYMGDGNDYFSGGNGNDIGYGEAGFDNLVGGSGNDLLDGGSENDLLFGQAGADTLKGGSHDDYLDGGADNDILHGGSGNDTLFGGAGIDQLLGQDGNDTISGDDGNDSLYGGSGNDWLSGGVGNDTLSGEIGTDLLVGGDGDDILHGGNGNDSLYGGNHNDTLYGGNHNDLLSGEAGDDVLHGNAGNDRLYGGDGNDHLHGEAGRDTLVGGNHDDYLHGGDANDTLVGGTGNDTLLGANDHDRLYGDAGNDNLNGNAGNDRLHGGVGADTLHGETGSDILIGGDGDDKLFGGADNDTLQGDAGDDYIQGDAGNDVIYGVSGNNWLHGGSGTDVVYGGTDNDTVYGGSGSDLIYGADGSDLLDGGTNADQIYGGAGHDIVNGGAGDDHVYGEAGNDAVSGGSGADAVHGGLGNDKLNGGDGSDHLFGGAGADLLYGGADDDTLIGGTGSDTFIFRSGDTGHDIVTDFSAGASPGDILQFETATFAYYTAVLAAASDDGTDTTITVDAQTSVTLQGVVVSELHLDDFRFV